MRKKLGICLTLLMVLPGLLFMASCATTPAGTSSSGSQNAATDSPVVDNTGTDSAAEELKNEFIKEDLFFEFDSATLNAGSREALNRKAVWMKNNPNASAVIEGHCDERGTTEYNLALGDRRAESAKSFLVNLGISATRLATTSYGEEMPIDPGHNEAAWTKNRRAHFTLK